MPSSEGAAVERNYTSLDPEKVAQTISRLRQRITERFPDSGLSAVCGELESTCEKSAARIAWIERPLWHLCVIRYSLVLLIVAGLAVGLLNFEQGVPRLGEINFIDAIQALEAGLNDVILISVALFFVWGLESRIKRRRAMKALHELRSIAHVIDMHQLTKDPDRLQPDYRATESSPPNRMNDLHLMRRYLDYCAEMLSLTGKVAALYLKTLDDPTVVATVNEIEDLTTGLSRKIWQKIDTLRPKA